jgi:hypothetical protein
VDYVAVINEKYGKGVKPAENGYVAWVETLGTGPRILWEGKEQVLALCGAENRGAVSMLEIEGNKVPELKLSELLSGEPADAIGRHLESQGPALTRLKAAGERPRWWSPVVETATGEWAGDASYFAWQRAAWDLCARAELRAGKGNFAGFLEDVGTLKRLARHAGQARLWDRETAGFMDQAASQAVAAVAARGMLTGPQCVEAAKLVDGYAPLPSVAEVVDTVERWQVLNRAERLAMGRPVSLGGKESVVLAAEERGRLDWDMVLRQANGLMDDDLTLWRDGSVAQGAAWLEKRAPGALSGHGSLAVRKQRSDELPETAFAEQLVGAGLPTRAFVGEMELRQTNMEAEMARAILAAARWKAEKGHWPEKLETLVPGYLKALPRDPYSGEGAPVHYVVRETGVALYAVGLNGQDDVAIGNRPTGDDRWLGVDPR